jgi:predicted small lipoprotein YifL
MKKVLTVLLVLALTLSMAACGASGKQEGSPAQNDEQGKTENIVFKYGTVDGGVYENDIAGLGFRFDEAGLMEEPMGAYRDSKPAEEIAENMLGTLVVELHCKNKDIVDENGEFLTFMIVTINVQETADSVSDYLKNLMDSSIEDYSSGKGPFEGYKLSGNDRFSGQIGGKDFEAYELLINNSTYGSNIVKRVYFARYGQYIYRISFDASDSEDHSSFDELRQEIDRLISGYFYALV